MSDGRSVAQVFLDGLLVTRDIALEQMQTHIDGLQLDDRRPGASEELERASDLTKRILHLLIDAERDGAREDRRRQRQKRHVTGNLEVRVPRQVEVGVVEIEPEVVFLHI